MNLDAAGMSISGPIDESAPSAPCTVIGLPANPSSDSQQPNGIAAVRDHEIDFRLRWRSALLPILLVCAIVALVPLVIMGAKRIGFTALTGPVSGGIVGGVAGISSTIVLSQVLARASRRAFESSFKESTAAGSERALASLRWTGERFGFMGFAVSDQRGVTALAARKLAECGEGGLGHVHRIGTIGTPLPPIGPILETAFEPTPINAVRESFIELYGAKLTSKDHLGAAWRTMVATLGRRTWFRTAMIVLMCLGYATIALMFLDGLRQLLLGRMSQSLYLGLLLLVAFGLVVLWQQFRTDTLFAVPSGVIVLSGSWRTAKMKARLLTRENAALLYIAPISHIAIAAPDGFVFQRRLGPFEVDLLLRAWLSPAPPPDPRVVDAFADTPD